MNILLVSHDFYVTGAPNSLLRQAIYFKEAGHTVDVWSLGDGPLKERYIEKGFCPTIILNNRRAILKAYKNADKKYDFILCNTTVTYKCADVLQRQGVPVVWFIRETMLVDKGMREDPDFANVFSHFYNLYTVSDYAAGVVKKYNPNVRVINNGIIDSFSDFTPLTGKVRFGFIGSIMEIKGIDLLVSAFLKLYQENPDIELYIAGKVTTDFAKELVEKTKSCPAVKWLGEVQGKEKDAFFNAIDVLCVPSIDEPSGLTLIEGAMKGKALVTTDTVGANYLVAENGFIVKTGDETALLEAMKQCTEKPLRKMQEKSREMYLKLGTAEVERKNVLQMLADNVGNMSVVKTKLKLEKAPLFQKIRKVNGRRHIYFCGIKIFSYKRLKKVKESQSSITQSPSFKSVYARRFKGLTEQEIRYCVEEQFKNYLGYPLNLDNPQTFNEKLQWLKLYYHDPLMTKCADKVAVRAYVKEKIGEGYLVPCLGVWDSPDAIDFDKLPNRFVLKVNWGSGQNIIVKDKSKLNVREAKEKLRDWMKPENNLYFRFFERAYKDIQPKIIAEKYIEESKNQPVSDYKFFCYHGDPKFMYVAVDSFNYDIMRVNYYDCDFNKLPLVKHYPNINEDIPKPKMWNKMIEISKVLSKPFLFVRVDFFVVDGSLKVGELTFYPGGGIDKFEPVEWDYRFGAPLTLPKKRGKSPSGE